MNDKHPFEDFKYCPKCGSADFRERNDKSKYCEHCDFTYYFNPAAAGMCFITDRFNRVLVAIRGVDPAKGTYDLPGGFMQRFETAEEGMAREILEETKINAQGGTRAGVIAPLKYLFSLPNIYRYSNFDVHTVDMVFHMAVESLEPYVGKGDDDVAELKAISFKQLNPEKFGLASVKKAVELIKAERYF